MSYTILTGDRATGPLHLGHFVGSLRQRVELQHQHNQTVMVADLQGLTDNGNNPQKSAPTCSTWWPTIWRWASIRTRPRSACSRRCRRWPS
ncbi:hypothetical protein M8494_18690 [Serratia ureilytica]